LKQLFRFKPNYIQDFLIEKVNLGFIRDDLYNGQMIGILGSSFSDMLNRDLNFSGIYKVPEILEKCAGELTSSDKALNNEIHWVFS